MTNIINDILDYLEVKHTKQYVNKLFIEHPHNDDMYGLMDMLKKFNIESVGIESKDKDLLNIHFPSLFHIKKKFVLGIQCENNSISYISEGEKKNMDYRDFSRIWDGNILAITSTEEARENDYFQHLSKEWIIRLSWLSLLIIPIIVMLLQLFFSHISYNNYYFPFIINIIGFVICSKLILKQLKGENKIDDKFCSILSEKGCDAVLTSGNSSIFYIYTWSEIGLSYFITNSVILVFANQFLSGQIIINLFAMAFGFWSVWYQARVVKKWCTLCLCVQICIWVLGIYYLSMLYNNYLCLTNVISSMTITLLAMIFILSNLHFLLRNYSDQQKISLIKQKLSMFQVDNDVLKTKYNKKERFSDSAEFSNIFFGNQRSSYQLTILTNPHCPHCVELHKKIEPIMQIDKLNIGIRFVFASFGPQYDNACKMLIAARKQLGIDKALDLYSLWFNSNRKNIDIFIKSYGLDIEDDDVIQEYNKHKKWIKINHLSKSPVVLINGFVIPEPYEIIDINNMDEL